MPTYVYECATCNATFEVEQRITEDPLDACSCGAQGTVRRLIQPIAVMFKGSGFHINDYGAKPTTPESSKPSAALEPAAPATPTTSPAE